jgi:predicted transcriptional regulator
VLIYNCIRLSLAATRRWANVAQQELAAMLDKPQSFISEYERGQRRVDVVEVLVISCALGVDPLRLFREIVRLTGRLRATTPSQ